MCITHFAIILFQFKHVQFFLSPPSPHSPPKSFPTAVTLFAEINAITLNFSIAFDICIDFVISMRESEQRRKNVK